MVKVILKKGEGRTIKSGGMWVYDNEIDKIDGQFENGDIVDVYDYGDYFQGRGFINTNSKITIRLLTRKKDQLIDDNFLKMRVNDAVKYRMDIGEMSSCRLIFGEADFLPGLTIDKFSDILVVQSLALGIDKLKLRILNVLTEILAENGYPIRGIYERSDAKVRLSEGLERTKGFISDEFDTMVPIEENGIKYIVDVQNGQKTGYFLDQKYNRRAIQNFCKNARVLDCFTHTGSFALNAVKGGAREVIAVDASQTAIDQAIINAKLNNMQDKVTFICADVFEFIPKLKKDNELFDVVILDPPAFTKSRASVKAAVKGYKEINLRGMGLVKPGGYLITCSCSHFMEEQLFKNTIAAAARDAHKRIRQVEFRTQACDHPILWSSGESYYLKFYILQVLDEK